MSELVILFAASYCNVLALGLQQLNVNYGHKLAAFVTAFLIGIPFVLGVTMLPTAGWPERIAFLLGGPCGIVSAMWLHPHLLRWFGTVSRGGK